MLVLFYKSCLNNNVQKHTHIQAVSELYLLGNSFFAKYRAKGRSDDIAQIRRKSYIYATRTKPFRRQPSLRY